jgi:inosine-uridine nucleoside N-ribohydrolase
MADISAPAARAVERTKLITDLPFCDLFAIAYIAWRGCFKVRELPVLRNDTAQARGETGAVQRKTPPDHGGVRNPVLANVYQNFL